MLTFSNFPIFFVGVCPSDTQGPFYQLESGLNRVETAAGMKGARRVDTSLGTYSVLSVRLSCC